MRLHFFVLAGACETCAKGNCKLWFGAEPSEPCSTICIAGKQLGVLCVPKQSFRRRRATKVSSVFSVSLFLWHGFLRSLSLSLQGKGIRASFLPLSLSLSLSLSLPLSMPAPLIRPSSIYELCLFLLYRAYARLHTSTRYGGLGGLVL